MQPDFDSGEINQRLEQYLQLYDLNMELAEAGVKLDYPQASPEQVRQLLAQRIQQVREGKWKGHGPSDAAQR
ncbi:MAG TPA: hypothetical protein PLN21_15730 [Gemmatales bacterium]|nr:hypothetical protein [Gemmatales bacterium]